MTQLLRALPDLVRLIAKLVRDPTLPRAAKVALAAVMVYLVSPIDLIPDFIPFLGRAAELGGSRADIEILAGLGRLARAPGPRRPHPRRVGSAPAQGAHFRRRRLTPRPTL